MYFIVIGFCFNAMAVVPFDPQTSMCTIDTFGITEGNAEMKAMWTPNIIVCDPGTYLPKNQLECVTCVENYWCPGVETTISIINKGINECETGFSAPGATSADECCPYGYSWNGTTCESICRGTEIWDGDMCIETCSTGTIWDYEEKSCVSVCREELGETWDEETQSCREKCMENEIWEYGIGCHEKCADGFSWNGEKCANDKCWSNEDWDEVTEQCVPKCKNNMDYDPISGICHEKCPTGQVWDYISGCRPDCGKTAIGMGRFVSAHFAAVVNIGTKKNKNVLQNALFLVLRGMKQQISVYVIIRRWNLTARHVMKNVTRVISGMVPVNVCQTIPLFVMMETLSTKVTPRRIV